MTDGIVFDSSAILAFLYGEPGADLVRAVLSDRGLVAYVSAVNLCEVATKLIRYGATQDEVNGSVGPFLPYVVAFDTKQSLFAAQLSKTTRPLGLSLGDRACLALAASMGAVAWTTDMVWKQLDIGVRVELIRS